MMIHRQKKSSGFTLTEILVVIVIAIVLTSIAYPKYTAMMERFHAEEGKTTLMALLAAQKRYSLRNGGSYASSLNNLDVDLRPLKYFDTPTVAGTNPIAQITRTSSYTLTINDSGVISCSGGAAGLCARIGY